MTTITYHGCGHYWTGRIDYDEIGRPYIVQGWVHVWRAS